MSRTKFLSIRQLELIATLTELGSVQDAANVLCITQSTATKSLQKVEEIFDTPLFHRSSKGLILTRAGKIVSQHANVILVQISKAERELSNLKKGISGELTIGIPTGASGVALHQAIIQLKSRRPNISIVVREAPNVDLMSGLINRELDLIIGRHWRQVDMPGVQFEQLYDEIACLCVRPQHPMSGKISLSLEDLVDLDWILPPVNMSLRRQIEDSFFDVGTPLPTNYVESSMVLSNSQMLYKSDVIGVWPFQAIREKYLADEIKILPVTLPRTINQIGISTRSDEEPSVVLQQFIEEIRTVGSVIQQEQSEWRTIFDL